MHAVFGVVYFKIFFVYFQYSEFCRDRDSKRSKWFQSPRPVIRYAKICDTKHLAIIAEKSHKCNSRCQQHGGIAVSQILGVKYRRRCYY